MATATWGWDEGVLLDLNAIPELECPICMCVMRDAVMGPCQHSFCAVCLQQAGFTCPLCRAALSRSLPPNRLARCIIDRLRVRCVHAEAGCDKAVTVGTAPAHAASCDYQPVPCPNRCKTTVLRKESTAHAAMCPLAVLRCAQCRASYLRQEEAAHSCVGFLRERVRRLGNENAAMRPPRGAPSHRLAGPDAAFPTFGHWKLDFTEKNNLRVRATNGSEVELRIVADSSGWFNYTVAKGEVRTVFSTHTGPDGAVPVRGPAVFVPLRLPRMGGLRTFALFTNAPRTELYIFTSFETGGKQMVLLRRDSAEVVFRNSAKVFSKIV